MHYRVLSQKITLIVGVLIILPVLAVTIGLLHGNQDAKTDTTSSTSPKSVTDIENSIIGFKQYIPHPPIYINGDTDFVVGQNGVVRGNGTSNNPFVIEGWEIETLSQPGIRINCTDKYFVVRDCYIHGIVGQSYDGIVLLGVRNGTIEYNIITGNENGIRIAPGPLTREDTSGCMFSNNTIVSNNNTGIIFEHIGAPWHSHNLISHNNFSENNVGLQAIMFDSNIIVWNNITNNVNYGISLFMCIGGGMYNYIHHNNFIGNNGGGVQACDGGGGINYWNTSTEGNYWSDYQTRYPWAVQVGNVWNYSYELDGGIGARDFYPLVNPVPNAGAQIPEYPYTLLPILLFISLFVFVKKQCRKSKRGNCILLSN